MAIAKGQKAPPFSLYDSDKNKVSLEDLKGKNILILFFPLAFTRVCTAELCDIRDNMTIYNNTNAQVLGISVDSLYVLNKFKAEQHLNFPLLSDFNKEASRAFDVLYEDFSFGMKGVSKRAAFILDKEGIIQYAEECANAADLPDFKAIRTILENLN
ncbi:MAG: redoxin domain-containing protein [Ferruginibacter sp.]